MTAPIFATALGSALMAGAFFVFSAFVMPGLDRLPAEQGIAAMQSINERAVTPVFMTALFGTALACVALAVWAIASWGDRRAGLVLAGAATYIVGAIVVTIAANVPRNDELEKLDAAAPHAAGVWRTYVSEWTAFNHVRGAAALIAAALLIAALLRDDA